MFPPIMEFLVFSNVFLSFLGLNQSLIFSTFFLFLLFFFNMGKESLFFHLDLLSWSLILLTLFVFMLILLSVGIISFLFQFLCFFLMVTFLVSNIFLFFILFEWTVFPTFFLILGFGYNSGRLQASLFFLFYTMTFSLPFLFFTLMMFMSEGSMSMFLCNEMEFCFLWGVSILMVFSSKLPIYYLHLWLPSAHVEAPLGGSMVLAAILLKLGSYGILRMLVLFFWLLVPFKEVSFCVGLVGSFLSGLSCYSQVDLKRMVAFMSISHMGIIFSGLMTFMWSGVIGSLMFMISHGLVSSGLFFLVNLFYQRVYSRSLMIMKSGSSFMSYISFFSFILLAGNLALPPTLSFISEVHLFWSLVSFSFFSSLMIFFLVIISTGYTIHLYISMFHGGDHILSEGVSGSVHEVLCMFSHFSPLMMIIIFMSSISLLE